MSVLDLILKHDPQVRLLWAGHCDCTPERRLICSVYIHQGARYLPAADEWQTRHHGCTGQDGTLGATPGAWRHLCEVRGLQPLPESLRRVLCALASAFVAIRMGLPADDPFQDNEHVTTLKVPVDGAAEVLMKPAATRCAPNIYAARIF